MARDHLRNLECRGGVWYVAREIAPALRPMFGNKRRLVQSLRTKSLAEALRRRVVILGEWEKRFAQARRGVGPRGEGLEADAMRMRSALDRYLQEDDEARLRGAHHEMEMRAEQIDRGQGEGAARAFVSIALGNATPLAHHLADWLAERPYTERTKSEHRFAVAKLEEWLKAEGLPVTVEAVTEARAAEFKRVALVKGGVHYKTANKWLSSLRQYWKWLIANKLAAGPNPWAGTSLPKPRRGREDEERPFTDDEVRKLLRRAGDTEMRDVMMLAALSGMRLEELFQLRLEDCEGGVFNVRHSKTRAGVRKVPIHRQLRSIVKRLGAERAAKDFLIEQGTAGWDGARSGAFSKRFATYRRSVGVDDMSGGDDGRRRSRVNFHSFRRWFATKAEQAGNHLPMVARVMGHEIPGMTFGLYSAGPSLEQLAVVVDSVKLPKGSV